MASSAPPPRHEPCTAAMVIFLLAITARKTAWNFVSISATLSGVCAATSTPAENARSDPCSTSTEILFCSSKSEIAWESSSIMAISITLMGGFCRVMRTVGGCGSNTMREKVFKDTQEAYSTARSHEEQSTDAATRCAYQTQRVATHSRVTG